MEALRAETSIAELCRKYTINESQFYKWNKEFLEAGKKRLAGDTTREATSDEVAELKKENQKLNIIDAFANRTRVQPPLIKLKLDTDGKTRTIGSGTKKSKFKGTKLKNKKFR